MKTVVVLSGKGGAGKTSVAAGLAAVIDQPVLADADVGASNLPLLLGAQTESGQTFRGSRVAVLEPELCSGCGECLEACRFGALSRSIRSLSGVPNVDELSCEGCGVCTFVCPTQALSLAERVTGECFVSNTPYGPLVHAELAPGGENSGALVQKVRRQAAQIATQTRRQIILVDGPPGIGCPVISSLSGTDGAVIVTEPTPSGLSDLRRVLELTRHFGIPAGIVLNKADLNPQLARALEEEARSRGAGIISRFPFCDDFRQAISRGVALSTLSSRWKQRFEQLWQKIETSLGVACG